MSLLLFLFFGFGFGFCIRRYSFDDAAVDDDDCLTVEDDASTVSSFDFDLDEGGPSP